MPELPEVETIRAQLAVPVAGRTVTAAWGFDSPKFSAADAAVGYRVVELRRRGKYLLADLHGPARPGPTRTELVVHLGMTGRLALLPPPADRSPGDGITDPHLRAWWDLDDGSRLTLHDARRFGRVAVVPAGRYQSLPTLLHLGPEPLSESFDAEVLRHGLTGRRALKTALLDQRLVAGIGNIYADEALWRARISPTARRLGRARAETLHAAIVWVLSRAIDRRGTTLRDYRDATGAQGSNQHSLACYGRAGLPCRRCRSALSHRVLDARSTTWCRTCQT